MRRSLAYLIPVALVAISVTVHAGLAPMPSPPIVGRWDLTVHHPQGDYPSWVAVQQSGYATLVGHFVGRFGSVRPISRVTFAKGHVEFSVPPQWENVDGLRLRETDLVFEGELAGDKLSGATTSDEGQRIKWSALRAPSLKRAKEPVWGEPVELFNKKDLTGWRTLERDAQGWIARNGLLVNARPGSNLATTEKFTDFKLHAEFRYPRGSNSGIYLRGRYEVQIEDNYGEEPSTHGIGGVYGFLKPRINASKKPGEWQTYDITLVGRTVTVVLNGETVIDRQEIPGPTGGAIDNHEELPGPIYLQGDHGPIDFRKLTLTPGK